MSAIALEILIIFLLILANGVFAMSEMAVVTARKIRHGYRPSGIVAQRIVRGSDGMSHPRRIF